MLIKIIFCIGCLALSFPTHAQFLKKLKEKVQEKVENKIINDAGNASEDAVDKAKKAGQGAIQEKAPTTATAQGQSNNPGNDYDFTAGEHTLFAIDFTDEQIGNFPRRLEFIGGNFEVVDQNGRRFGRAKDGDARFSIQLPQTLPEKFSIQLQLHDPYWLDYATITTTPKVSKGESLFYIYSRKGVGVVTKEGPSSTGDSKAISDGVASIEIMVDGSYAKMFVDGKRVANIPNANFKRTDKLYFSLQAGSKPEDYIYITDIRIASGGRDLYQTLEEEGRVSFNDIHFATNKAEILPESNETLQQIGQLLQEHPQLSLLIEGHTDNTGDFDNNMELSKQRAEAVRSHLIDQYGISKERLRSMGQGQTQPISTNDTEEGRAKNRRVEIVKI